MSVRMKLSNGSFVYPENCGKDERENIRNLINNQGVTMWCSCGKKDEFSYKISKDLRFIPCRQLYEHADWCDKNGMSSKRNFTVRDDGSVMAILGFNPFLFSFGKEDDEEGKAPAKKKKNTQFESSGIPVYDKPFRLNNLIRKINREAYLSRVIKGQYAFLSADYFRNCVMSYAKRVCIKGCAYKLGELRLDSHRVSFFYNKFIGIEKNNIIIEGGNKKVYRYFITDNTITQMCRRFIGRYGMTYDEAISAGYSVLASGFMYRRKSKSGNEYTVVGRCDIFIVNDFGLYCDSVYEVHITNSLMNYARNGSWFTLLYPDNECAVYEYVVARNGIEAPLFLDKKPIGFDETCFECYKNVPTQDEINKFLYAVVSAAKRNKED